MAVPPLARALALALALVLLPARTTPTPAHAAALAPAAAAADAAADDDPLARWLRSVVFHIPTESFVRGLFTVSDLACTNLTLGEVASAFDAPLGYSLGVDGLGLNCTGRYHVGGPLPSHGAFGVGTTDSTARAEAVLSQYPTNHTAKAATAKGVETKLNLQVWFNEAPPKAEGGAVHFIVDEALDAFIEHEVKGLIDTNLTLVLHAVNDRIRPYLRPRIAPDPYPQPPAPVLPYLIDLQNSSGVGLADFFLDHLLGLTSPASVNALANRLTHGTGVLNLPHLAWTAPPIDTALGNLSVRLDSLRVAGLNGWSAWEVLVPSSPYVLNSTLDLDSLDLRLGFSINVTLPDTGTVSGTTLAETAELHTAVSRNELQAWLELALFHNLTGLSPSQLVTPQCLLQSVYLVNFTQLLLTTDFDAFQLTARGGDLEADIDAALNRFVQLFTTSFESVLSPVLNGLVAGPGTLLATDYLNTLIASSHCPPPHTNTVSRLGSYIAAGACLALSLATLLWVWLQNSRAAARTGPAGDQVGAIRRHTNGHANGHASGYGTSVNGHGASINGPPAARPVRSNRPGSGAPRPRRRRADYGLVSGGEGEAAASAAAVADVHSLATNPQVPAWARYGLPVVCVVGVATFASAHTSLGAGVMVRIEIGGQALTLPSLFNFTLGNSIKDMWNAKVYALSIFIALFSGAWAYAKILIMYVCWMLPAGWLSVQRRESCLMFLDAYGKWSLIDAYVLILMIVAFSFNLVVPSLPEPLPYPEAKSSATAYVSPGWGFYGFLLATAISLVLTHVMLHFHRACHHVKPRPGGQPRRLAACPFVLGGRRVRFSGGGGLALVPALLLAALALLWVGIRTRSYEFQFEGLFVLVLEYLGLPVRRPYSVISLGAAIPLSGVNRLDPGILLIQAAYLLFTIAIPTALLFVLLALWLVPMRPSVQRRVFVASEVLNAWGSLEVFVFSIIVALLELEQFALFIVGDKCDLINSITAEYFDDLVDGDDQCFDVVARLAAGCYTLVGACLVNFVVSRIVMATCHAALHERVCNDHAAALLGSASHDGDDDDDDGEADGMGANGDGGPEKPRQRGCLADCCFSLARAACSTCLALGILVEEHTSSVLA